MANSEKSSSDTAKEKTKKSSVSSSATPKTMCQPTPQELILSAATLTLLLAEGRSRYEVETLINLLSLTTRNLQSVLTQILINEKTPDILDIGI